jgi:thiamine pyrophosphate-dependent acetolactate synthase large subunit-like protein
VEDEMNATEVARTLVERSPDALLVASLGTATSALRSASDDGPHLYFGGAMGSAAATALGIADAVPEREVIALVGDGDLLMGASTLWSISALAPANLLLVALVDGHYSITGGQPISAETRFVEVARSLCHLAAARAHSTDELASLLPTLSRPGLLEAVLDERTWPGSSPFVDPHHVRRRFAARVNDGSKQDGSQTEGAKP